MNTTLVDLQLPDHSQVLVIAACATDVVLGGAGLLALLSSEGACISVDVVTGSGLQAESLEAANLLGYAMPRFWGIPERQLKLNEELIQALVKRVMEVGPHLVLAPSVWEIDPDRLVLAYATIEAMRRAGLNASLLCYEVEIPLAANWSIDISEVQHRKLSAMRCFKPHVDGRQFGMSVEALNRYRGESRIPAAISAEAFNRTPVNLIDFAGVNLKSLTSPVQTFEVHPKVSVLIRSTRRPELQDALASVLLQTYASFEVVIVNASGNNEIEVLPTPNVVPIRVIEPHQRLSRSQAANVLLAACTGEYALFLDDDDWLLPGHIESLVGAFASQPNAVAVYGDTVCVERQGAEWREVRRFEGPIEKQRLAFENRLPIHAVMFRMAAAKGLQFDQEFDLYEDWDWWLQLAHRGDMVHVSAVGAVYRIHSAGGEGVRADQQRALAALGQIVLKWHQSIDVESLTERVAYVKQLIAALQDEQSRSTQLLKRADESDLAVARVRKQHEEAMARYERVLHWRDEQVASGLAGAAELKSQLGLATSKNELLKREVEQITFKLNENENESTVTASLMRQAEVEQKLEAIQSEFDVLRGELEAAKSELDGVHQLKADAQRELATIYRSNSWRITRPVRGFARFGRQLIGLESSTMSYVTRLKRMVLGQARTSVIGRWLYYRLPLSEAQRFKLRAWGANVQRVTPLDASSPQTGGAASSAEGTHRFLLIQSTHDGAPFKGQLPLVSIIIPCFNQGQFLIDSIGSSYAAYSGPLEIIVINDGSTAPVTLRCLKDIATLFPEVKVINQVNGGLSRARNAGIEASQGAFLQFLDADDLLVPGKLDAQVRHLIEGGLDVSICNYLIADATLKQHAKTDETIAIHTAFELADFLFKWERTLSIPIHCGLFSRKALTVIRFNTELHAKEDWFLWCCLAKSGFIPKYVDFCGAVYRMHDGSMRRSFVRMARQWMQAVTFLDQLVADQYPDFFEQSVLWVNQYYRTNPIYQDEIKAMLRPS